MKRLGLAVVFVILAGLGYVYLLPHTSSPPAGKAIATTTAAAGKPAGKGRSAAVPSIVAATAKTQDVPITKTVVGNIEPIATVVIKPQADGVVTVTNVQDGQMVKTGDVLFQLDDRTIRATIDKDKAALAKDQANLESASQDLAAAQDLSNRKIGTLQQAYQALAAVNALKASIGMDNAQIQADEVQLSYMTITAPIDGRVGVVNTSVGNLVRTADTGAGLLTITRMAPLRVSFTVAESDLPTLRDAMKDRPLNVLIRVPGSKNVVASGPLNFVDSSVDTASGTIVLKAEVTNENGALWPGQYVTATVEIGTHKGAVTVPLIAIQQGSDGTFAFVVKPDKTVAKQMVTVVETVGDTAVTTAGLKSGDHVVVDGQLHLQDGSTVIETLADESSGNPTVSVNDTSATDPIKTDTVR
ncbi:efflux RND transporter periplasmic adaptor subunit (plasmid) [Phyllobacterium sp. 628]|uniref:efflux RND transporter periplasmic adaptor subunit n=1 Tax=Phyllobacterium sp. 628 TaxID=2718938 RepID=UPI0016623534|nr:efflux RND transporter periplasmic adaptor subunit [Phyllobacterium sp. 628]QND50466.1 efflux RND transporter periplasmic adaptor subunit [Phyllobacterium sp. 628]